MDASIFDTLGFGTLKYHWQAVLLSTVICCIIFEASRLISPLLFPKTFQFFKGYNAPNWHVHVVSTIHCITVVIGSFFIMTDEILAKDRVFGYSYWAANIYSISCGYFLWDTFVALHYIKHQGISMVCHGIASFAVFIFSYYPFVNYYGAIFLMYELSTIFLNFNWFMDKIGWTGTRAQLINGIFLILAFFGARVVFGIYMTIQMWTDIYAVKELVPWRYIVVYGSANCATVLLNLYWFRLMINMLRKRFPGNKTDKELK
ncbi:TLC domain-containing protein [Chlamydoabsidia padenii]|nr:TLC domain-containing protein [Chlamydoabsidia padenii]